MPGTGESAIDPPQRRGARIDEAWRVQRRVREGKSTHRADDRGDRARRIHHADDGVARGEDEEIALRVDGDAGWLPQESGGRGASVAARSGRARRAPGDGRDDSVRSDLPHVVGLKVEDVDVAVRVGLRHPRLSELRRSGRPAVAGKAMDPVSAKFVIVRRRILSLRGCTGRRCRSCRTSPAPTP